VEAAGQWIAAELRQELNAPVLCSLDGVLDADGKIWWLEANSNPMFPPTGYPPMFSTLFGTPLSAPEPAPATVPVDRMAPDMPREPPNSSAMPAMRPAGIALHPDADRRIAA